jgi:hypothetical protein
MITLERVFYASQIIAALCVAASVVFVILELRANTKSQRVVAVNSLSVGIAQINVASMQSPALGDALAIAVKDWSAATREQRIVAHYFLFTFFKLHENAWYQERAGMLERDQWQAWERSIRLYYHSPGVQKGWWPRRHDAFSAAFQDWLAGTTPPEDVAALSELFDDAKPAAKGKG